QEIVVITAYLMSLDAGAGIFKGLDVRQSLREKPSLHLLCDFQFLCDAAFRFQLLGGLPSLGFNCSVDLIVADKRKGVSVHIRERGKYSAPNRLLWRFSRYFRRAHRRRATLILDLSFVKTPCAPNPVDSFVRWRHSRFLMLNAIVVVMRFVILLFGG